MLRNLTFIVLIGLQTIQLGAANHYVSAKQRRAAISRAQVWAKTNVPSMNIKAGPRGSRIFAPNKTVTCRFVDKKTAGNSPKFDCALSAADEVKVKYGRDNGEVYGEVAATRLLWALGFAADAMYPVRVVCRGCPEDPNRSRKGRRVRVVFDPATIERKMPGRAIETHDEPGWAWPELDLVDEGAGGAPRAHRDALKLLAVFLQHTDNKAVQQRILCVGKSGKGDEPCAHPIMMLNDLGLTFGHANLFNRDTIGSVNLKEWSRANIWLDDKRCIGDLPTSQSGTLNNPRISEAGRKFLADLLAQLSDAQIHDLFEVSRVTQRVEQGTKAPIGGTSVDEWVKVFKQKRDEIVNHACPD